MKSLFSMRLYREGVLRVRGLGIFTLAITLFFCLNDPITRIMTSWIANLPTGSLTGGMTTANMVGPLLPAMFMTPILALFSFAFLNRRSSCDFYYALPYCRVTIYSCFSLGIFTWTIGSMVVSMLLRCLLYSFCEDVTFRFSRAMLILLSCIISSLFLYGMVTLALSLTGTYLSNVVAIISFLVTPYLVGEYFLRSLSVLVPIADITYSPLAVFSKEFCLPLVLCMPDRATLFGKPAFTHPILLVYTAVIGIGSIALAFVAFSHRKGSTATTPGATPFIRHLFRILLTLPITVQVATLIVGGIYRRQIIGGDSVLWPTFLLSFVAILAYFLYEMFSTGRIAHLKKLLLLLPTIYLPVALYLGGVFLISSNMYHKNIDLKDIQEVTLQSTKDGYTVGGITVNAGGITTDDPATIAFVHQAYQDSIEAAKNGKFSYLVIEDSTGTAQFYQHFHAKIKLKNGMSVYRILRAPSYILEESAIQN